jgi:hypothetical protein
MGAGMHLGIGWPRGRNFIFVPNTVHIKNHILHVGPILLLYYQKLRKQYKCEICKDIVYNAVSGWYCTFN